MQKFSVVFGNLPVFVSVFAKVTGAALQKEDLEALSLRDGKAPHLNPSPTSPAKPAIRSARNSSTHVLYCLVTFLAIASAAASAQNMEKREIML